MVSHGKKTFLNLMKTSLKGYDENSNKGYFPEGDVEYPKIYFIFIIIYHFYLKKRKLKNVISLFVTFMTKKNYVVYIRVLKQPLNHGFTFKKVYKIIQFNQKTWLKPYIDMNTKLRTEAKNFFKLMNNAVFGKTMGNGRKRGDIKLVTTDKRRNQLALEPNYHKTKYFSENLITIEMKKTKVKMNKHVYLGMSILDVSKISALLFILKVKIFMKTM